MPNFFDDPAMLAPPRAECVPLPGGGFILRSPEPLGEYERCTGEWLERWARETPDMLALAERAADGAWRRLTWCETRAQVGALAQALIDLDLPAQAPVVVLSDNSVDHALLMLACLHIGRPVCSVSSAYCRLSQDYVKIRSILQALRPALMFASDGVVYGPAIRASGVTAPVVLGQAVDQVPGAMALATLAATREEAAVMQAYLAVRPDDTAKLLLTSGSTGAPKVAINTHRMLCANQQMMAQAWRFLAHHKPVMVDWLPWSHTFGGNHNFNLVLRHGGTLYVDEGRPVPRLIDHSVRNLREVRPTLLFNVPRGFDMLLPLLEADNDVAREVLSNLQMVFYAGAALTPSTWQRLINVAQRVRTEPLWLTTAWGSTETAPAVTSAHWHLEGAGCIGLPLPGTELKFLPNAGKLELRVRGVNVFPGYRDAPHLTADAFDEDGFYKIGDAGLLVDEARPERGVLFNGRVAEDFKLSSGTWVSVGTLRVQLVSALAPYAQDAVITGHDRSEIGALVFPSAAATELPPEALAEKVGQALRALHQSGGGSSRCAERVLFLTEPPDADAGEITDKGYVNQRAVLARRADDVATLYREPADPHVIRTA
jgi:feruloyl-CoA synthase